jgi:hypothetical protein
MPNQRNQYDNSDCLERGESAELKFSSIARSRGWTVLPASSQQDINEHWDVLIEKEEERYRVDVKGMKKISRSDPEVQDTWIWVELHGVRQNDLGWLYGGNSDILAFEKRTSFIMVKRAVLIDLIPRIVDMDSEAGSAFDAQYRVYQRRGRPDKITLIETEELEAIKYANWEKV